MQSQLFWIRHTSIFRIVIGVSDIQDSSTAWIQQLKAGEAEAALHLWENYFLRMVVITQNKSTTETGN